MEEQIITIKIRTEGEKCEMSDAQIIEWYKKSIAGIFDTRYGTPQITVELERKEK